MQIRMPHAHPVCRNVWQLAINYTNERLHAHYLNATVRAEKSLHEAEGLRWQLPEIAQNEPILTLLDGHPHNSIFAMLDSQCQLPKGSDKAFVSSLFGLPPKVKNNLLLPPLAGKVGAAGQPGMALHEGFRLAHFSETVQYTAQVVP